MFPLKKGSNGAEVKLLQLHLQNKYSVVFAEGANGNFGAKTEEYVKTHLGVSEVSETLYKSLLKEAAKTDKIPRTPEEIAARRERLEKGINTGVSLFGQVLDYKRSREDRKSAEANAQSAALQPPPRDYPPPVPPSQGAMPKWLIIVVGVLLLGIVGAVVLSKMSKKEKEKDANSENA